MRMPSFAREYAVLQAEIVTLTGRALTPPEEARLFALTSKRIAAQEKLRKARADQEAAALAQHYWKRELYYLRQMEGGAVVEWEEEEPSFLNILWEQTKHNLDPRPLLNDMKQFVIESHERAERYRRAAMARGDYVGASFTQYYAVGEMTFESVSEGLQQASDKLAEAMEAETRSEAAVAGLEAALGLGKAGLAAYSAVAPFSVGGAALPGGGSAAALATSAGSRAAAAAGSAEAIVAGSLARPTIVLAVVGGDSEEGGSGRQTSTTESAGADKRVTFGKNATRKLRRHWGDIRRLTREHGIEMPAKFKQALSQIEEFIEDVVDLGETRVGPYKPTGGGWTNALWTRYGNTIVIRSPEREFVTILDAAGGGAAANFPGGL